MRDSRDLKNAGYDFTQSIDHKFNYDEQIKMVNSEVNRDKADIASTLEQKSKYNTSR